MIPCRKTESKKTDYTLNILIAGLAKSGTTMLFSRVKDRLGDDALRCYFEPHSDEQIADILDATPPAASLTKVLIGRVTATTARVEEFDRNIMIYRDPRDQFISMLLYLFYDFQVSGDQPGYQACYEALSEKLADPDGVSCLALWDKISMTVGRAPHVVFQNLHREQLAYSNRYTPYMARYETLLGGDWSGLSEYLDIELGGDHSSVPQDLQRVARSKGFGDWRYWLTAEDLSFINQHWSDNLAWLGYEPEEARLQEAIPKHTSLDYVRQFNPAGQPEA